MHVAHAVTITQMQEGRERLRQQEQVVGNLNRQIADAQRALEALIADSKLAIGLLEEERRRARDEVKATKEYLSPIKRLPDDLLQHIFLSTFEAAPSSAWTLSAVCVSWRRLVLNAPILWSRVCHVAHLIRYTILISK